MQSLSYGSETRYDVRFGVLGVKEDSDSKVDSRRDEDDQMDMWV